MNKKQFTRIIGWSTIALAISFLGQLFVSGWNWTWHDFLFAWVFFNLLGLAYTFVTSRIRNRGWRIAAGALVILAFASVWVMLATG